MTLTDCMTPGDDTPELLRLVAGNRGQVLMRLELAIRFDYGSVLPGFGTPIMGSQQSPVRICSACDGSPPSRGGPQNRGHILSGGRTEDSL